MSERIDGRYDFTNGTGDKSAGKAGHSRETGLGVRRDGLCKWAWRSWEGSELGS